MAKINGFPLADRSRNIHVYSMPMGSHTSAVPQALLNLWLDPVAQLLACGGVRPR